MPAAAPARQHEILKKQIKLVLFNADRSIAAVARSIGRPRTTVSQSINHGRFPDVLKEVRQEVGV